MLERSENDIQSPPSNPSSSSRSSAVQSESSSSYTPFATQYPTIPTTQQPQPRIATQQRRSSYTISHPNNQSTPLNINVVAVPGYISSPPEWQFQSFFQPLGPHSLRSTSTPSLLYQSQQHIQYPPLEVTGYPNPGAYGGYDQSRYAAHHRNQFIRNQPGGFGTVVPNQPQLVSVEQFSSPYSHAPLESCYYPYHHPLGWYDHDGRSALSYPTHAIQFVTGYTSMGHSVIPGLRPSQGLESTRPPAGMTGYGRLPEVGLSRWDDRYSMNSGTKNFPEPHSRSLVHAQQAGAMAALQGPPRKPRQSGHSLWVGNLPPRTTLMNLKDHFSKDATRDILSVFLISKSNCAFVNYCSAAACNAALLRFQDSKLQGVRLVCRVRKNLELSPDISRSPSHSETYSQMSPLPDRETGTARKEIPATDEAVTGPIEMSERIERYFIFKSLTLQDLEQSVRSKTWTTQAHNEETLRRAYESSDHVYLIFSANRSGEFFGYAEMTSSIGEAVLEESVSTPQLDNVIPTPANEFAPEGRITEDSARGTIFWESVLSEDEGGEEIGRQRDKPVDASPEAASSAWKPFKVEWISTRRLPFYRTRGMRNQWNANKEVKVARDGTELEPSVGNRLVQLFHRVGQSDAM